MQFGSPRTDRGGNGATVKPYTALYLKEMGYDESDWIKCEIIGCEEKAVDINHLKCRGMGGSKKMDYIENLQATCRHHHIKYADQKQYIDFLRYCHIKAMEERQVQFNPNLIKTDYL